MATYEEILSAMQEEYFRAAGFYADDASDIGIRLKVLASQLFSLSYRLDGLRAQVFPQTATGDALDRHAAARGLTRKDAAPARGVLRFSRDTAAPADVQIPEGTVCAAANGGLRFVTTTPGVLKAGQTQIDVPAQAQEGGAKSSVAPGVVEAMITPVQSVARVSNPAAFTGGADAETDDQLRARLLRSYAAISNGTNTAFYYDLAMGFEGVASANVVPRVSGRGTVGVYVACEGAAAPDALVEEIRQKFAAMKEINVDVTVKSARITPVNLTLEAAGENGVAFEALKGACTQNLAGYFRSLTVGQSLLLSALSDALFHTGGLYNHRLSVPASDRQAAVDELFIPGVVTIERMAVIV